MIREQDKREVVREQNGALVITPFLERGVTAACSTRKWDLNFRTQGEDQFEDNLKAFCDSVDVTPEDLVYFEQVHKTDIVAVNESLKGNGSKNQVRGELLKADGGVTSAVGIPIAIFTADCAPLFFFDQKKHSIGLAHIGWRGAQAGLAGKMVSEFKRLFRSDPINLKVAVGPMIRSCCYEVGSEFVDRFGTHVQNRSGKFYFDLAGFIQDKLLASGVPGANILDFGLCTVCAKDIFFSHRRDGEQAG